MQIKQILLDVRLRACMYFTTIHTLKIIRTQKLHDQRFLRLSVTDLMNRSSVHDLLTKFFRYV